MPVSAAYPFIDVRIDTSGLQPVGQRSPGVLAVVGATPAGPSGGAAAPNTPTLIASPDEAATAFAARTNGLLAPTPLYEALVLAMRQNPAPATLYGVRIGDEGVAGALASLEAADDVTFVVLADTTDLGAIATGQSPATGLLALKEHVETVSLAGNERIGVAMVDPSTAKGPTYAADVLAAHEPLRSTVSRMILVAARGAVGDAAVASAAAIAGLPPGTSILLKPVTGLSIPVAAQYGPAEVVALAQGGITPIIDPVLIEGPSLHFGDGRCFTTDDSILFVDTRRLLDDVIARLKFGLVGLIGDARITKSGLTLVRARIESIIGPLVRDGSVDSFSVRIPVLDILGQPEATRSATDVALVQAARANRAVEADLTLVLGPAAHHFSLNLAASN